MSMLPVITPDDYVPRPVKKTKNNEQEIKKEKEKEKDTEEGGSD